jgi:hypothetical protein
VNLPVLSLVFLALGLVVISTTDFLFLHFFWILDIVKIHGDSDSLAGTLTQLICSIGFA